MNPAICSVHRSGSHSSPQRRDGMTPAASGRSSPGQVADSVRDKLPNYLPPRWRGYSALASAGRFPWGHPRGHPRGLRRLTAVGCPRPICSPRALSAGNTSAGSRAPDCVSRLLCPGRAHLCDLLSGSHGADASSSKSGRGPGATPAEPRARNTSSMYCLAYCSYRGPSANSTSSPGDD